MNRLYEITILVPQTRTVVSENIKYAENVAKSMSASINGATLLAVKEILPTEKQNGNY